MNWTERRKQRARRRLLLRTVLGLSAGLAALSLAGLALESEQRVSGSALLDRSPEAIWRVLLDLDGMPLWRSDLAALERLPDFAGHPTWREIGPRGSRVIELSLAEPPQRLVLRTPVAGRPSLPLRTFELAAAPGGTLLTVTEHTLVRNPLRRVLYRLHPPRGVTRLLRDLDQRLSGVRRQVVARPK